MGFSKDDVIYMAKMAKLRFTDEEAEKLAEEIAMVLSVIGEMESDDTANAAVGRRAGMPGPAGPVVRPDEVVVFEDRESFCKYKINARNVHTGSEGH